MVFGSELSERMKHSKYPAASVGTIPSVAKAVHVAVVAQVPWYQAYVGFSSGSVACPMRSVHKASVATFGCVGWLRSLGSAGTLVPSVQAC